MSEKVSKLRDYVAVKSSTYFVVGGIQTNPVNPSEGEHGMGTSIDIEVLPANNYMEALILYLDLISSKADGSHHDLEDLIYPDRERGHVALKDGRSYWIATNEDIHEEVGKWVPIRTLSSNG